jgi:hypothetical protein
MFGEKNGVIRECSFLLMPLIAIKCYIKSKDTENGDIKINPESNKTG